VSDEECPQNQACLLGSCAPSPAIDADVWGNALTYTFEGNVGDTKLTVHDRSGRGHDTHGAPAFITDGRYGGGLAIDGSRENRQLQAGNYPTLFLGNQMTAEFWLRPETNGPYRIVGDRLAVDATLPSFSIEVAESGRLHFVTNSGCTGSELVTFTQGEGTQVPIDEWTHLAYTWDSQELRLYQNGDLTQTFAAAFEPCDHTGKLNIGNVVTDSGFIGTIDELKMSDYPKTAEAIQQSMNQDPEALLARCGDHLLHATEACDSSSCCQNDCAPRPNASLCPDGTCQSGVCQVNGSRVDAGLELLYEMNEGTGDVLADSLGGGPNLVIADPDAVEWVEDGIRFTQATVAESTVATVATALRCQTSSEATLEVWVTPASLEQTGPANIISYGEDVGLSNVALSQERDLILGRLRTSELGLGGGPFLEPEKPVDEGGLHLVLSQHEGGQRALYINGMLHHQNLGLGDLSSWAPAASIRLGNEITGDGDLFRPWLGTFHLVALYCRALSSTEVARNFAAGY